MEANSWRREKPLRTYGRQSNAKSEDQKLQDLALPLTKKKRKLSEAAAVEVQGEEELARPPRLDSHESKRQKQSPPTKAMSTATATATATAVYKDANVNKSSILSYFKPAAAPAAKEKVEERTAAESRSEPASPPSSTGSRTKRRARARLLRFKGPSTWTTNDDDTEDQEDELCRSKSTRRDAEDGAEEGRSTTKRQSSPSPRTGGLRNATSSLHNAKQPPSHISTKTDKDTTTLVEEKPQAQGTVKAAPTVQTTLNISSRAAFSECRVCDTVWNPQYPDDVRYHTKRHAAVLRGKKRKEASEL
jgi:hypothetical protein